MKYHIDLKIEQIKGETYEKFINISTKYSDMCSFDLYELPSKEAFRDMYDLIVDVIENPKLYEGYNKRIIYVQAQSLLKGIYHILDHYKIQLPFTQLLLQYEVKTIHTTSTQKFVKVCKEIEHLLLLPGSLLAWGDYKYPDNLCFYKNGVKWFASEQHEKGMGFYLEMLDEDIAEKIYDELYRIMKKNI